MQEMEGRTCGVLYLCINEIEIGVRGGMSLFLPLSLLSCLVLSCLVFSPPQTSKLLVNEIYNEIALAIIITIIHIYICVCVYVECT